MKGFLQGAVAFSSGISAGTIMAGAFWMLCATVPWFWNRAVSFRQIDYIAIAIGFSATGAATLATLATLGRWQTTAPDHETRCRKCGYILRGIPEPRCSECGERI